MNVFKHDSIKLARAAVGGDLNVQGRDIYQLPTHDLLFVLPKDLVLQSRHMDEWMTYLGILIAFLLICYGPVNTGLTVLAHMPFVCGDVLYVSRSRSA